MSKLKTMGKRGLSLLLSFLMLFSLLPVTALAAPSPSFVVTPNSVKWNSDGSITGTITVDGKSNSNVGTGNRTLAVSVGAVANLTPTDFDSDVTTMINNNASEWIVGGTAPTEVYLLPIAYTMSYSATFTGGIATIDLSTLGANFKIDKSALQAKLEEYSDFFDSNVSAVEYNIVVFFNGTAWNHCTGFTVNLADAPKYTVTYNANRGSVTPASAEVEQGQSVTLPTPTRSGYACTGWYTAASGGTKAGDPGASYTPAGDVTLYAQWKPLAVLTATPQHHQRYQDGYGGLPGGQYGHRQRGSH